MAAMRICAPAALARRRIFLVRRDRKLGDGQTPPQPGERDPASGDRRLRRRRDKVFRKI
jgi:hypothetical protein